MSHQKITPFIWFTANDGSLANIVSYYQSVFTNNFQSGPIMPLGETPSGKTEMVNVVIFGNHYSLMNTGVAHHALNDSVSFVINCENQDEIDLYWNYFTSEGQASQCGWCIDKYNLRWQIVPKNLGELLRLPNAGAVMMKQTKIIIADYF